MKDLETRQLGIEFERRVQTMIPETEFVNKLDTETIYSYLNQYLDKLIADLYRSIDLIPVSNNESYIEILLLSMKKSMIRPCSGKSNTEIYDLPSDFGLYISSYFVVKNTYEYKGTGSEGIVPATIIAGKDVNKVYPRPQDNMRILRNPVVWLEQDNKIGTLCDRYTTPLSFRLDYYKIPKHMDIMTSLECELPIEMFEQLVSGAVDLYVQYIAGAEARKRQMAEQLKQLLKQNKENE